jgi:hypothetical protein
VLLDTGKKCAPEKQNPDVLAQAGVEKTGFLFSRICCAPAS